MPRGLRCLIGWIIGPSGSVARELLLFQMALVTKSGEKGDFTSFRGAALDDVPQVGRVGYE